MPRMTEIEKLCGDIESDVNTIIIDNDTIAEHLDDALRHAMDNFFDAIGIPAEDMTYEFSEAIQDAIDIRCIVDRNKVLEAMRQFRKG